MRIVFPIFCRHRMTLGLLAVLGVTGVGSAPALAAVAYAVTADNRLLQFDTNAPGTIKRTVTLSGLEPTETVFGIDFRPASPGSLYGLGSQGQVYQINTSSGAASAVGAPLDPVTVPLNGSKFGFDFNPTVDRIRVVSDLSENYRLNPNDGSLTAVDGPLAYKSGDINAGSPPGVSEVAYTNGDNPKAATTTLYGIDSELGVLVKQDPANSGALATVGSLNQSDLPLFAGFDIVNGKALAATTFEPAFGSLSPLNATLFAVDLSNGQATSLGTIGDGSEMISGFAVGSAQAVPLPPAVYAAPLLGLVAMGVHLRMRRQTVTAG